MTKKTDGIELSRNRQIYNKKDNIFTNYYN